MKQSIKKSAILIFFCLLWIFPLINKNTEIHIWTFIGFSILCIIALLCIKNTVASFISAIILLIIPALFQISNLILTLPSFITIFCFVFLQKNAAAAKAITDKTNKQSKSTVVKAQKEKRTTVSYAGAFLSIIVSTCVCIWLFIKEFSGQNTETDKKYEISHMIIFGLFFLSGALAVICIQKKSVSEKTSYKKGFTYTDLSSLKSIYISGFLCLTQSILNFYISDSYLTNGSERAFFFPWFIFLSLAAYYEDPVFLSLAENAKKALKTFTV